MTKKTTIVVVGVLALQGGFLEHIRMLEAASQELELVSTQFDIIEVRNPEHLALCDGLVIPGGQSTSISLIASRTNMLEPLRAFVKIQNKPTWGTCAGLILLANTLSQTTNQRLETIGGMDVQVQRNFFGRADRSFEVGMNFPFLGEGERFSALFLDAPIVKGVTPITSATQAPVEILARLPDRISTARDQKTGSEDPGDEGIIVAVKQGNLMGTSFHPELGSDTRLHVRWLKEVVAVAMEGRVSGKASH